MYGQLPSQVEANATTFDIMVYDVMMSWEEYQRNQAEGKLTPPKLSEAEMTAMMERARNKNNGR